MFWIFRYFFPRCPYSIIITSLASPVKLLTDYQFSLWEKNRSLHIRKIMQMAGLHLGSVSMSLDHVAMRAHVEAWGITCDHVGIPGLCHSCSQADLGGQGYQLRPWYCLDQSCGPGPCLGLWPCRIQGLGWCLWLLRPSKTIPMPRVWVCDPIAARV